MAISITQVSDVKSTPKKRSVYDNYDKLKSIVHYDTNNQVDFVLKSTNNPTGKSLETKKYQQVHVDVVQSPTGISFDRATLTARIYKNDNSKVSETGFIVWIGDANDSVLTKQKFENVLDESSILKGSFTKQILNLLENTTYNYRAYVTHEYGTNYSKVYQFTTTLFSSVFSIAGTPTSGPAPLTVNLSGINAGTGITSYAWSMTGGPISFQYSVSGIEVTNSGSGYEAVTETVVLINNTIQPTITANVGYFDETDTFGISSIDVPAEVFGFTNSARTVAISSNGPVTENATGTASGSIQVIADYTTQAVTHTYLSAGTFNPIVYAINGNQVVKQATREIIATGGGGASYSADWTAITSSSYGNNIVAAYDFRNITNGTTVDAIVGPDLTLVGNTVVETDGDPYFNDVSLLLNMNGTNGSQVFVDSSTNNYSITAVNSAQISTSVKKYGSGSGHFPSGSNNKLAISVNTPLANFGTNDFTIEWWEYLTTSSGNIGIFNYGGEGQSGGSDQPVIGMRYESNSVLRVGYNRGSDNDAYVDFNLNSGLETNQWVHCALVRQSGSLLYFRNGTLNPTINSFNHNLPNASTINYPKNSTIGSFNGTSSDQYIDDLRITKGVARYIANFTPPEAELPNIVGNNIGVTFTPSPAYAVSNETISVTQPHTLVYVGKADATAGGEAVFMACQPIKYSQTGNQNVIVFTRPSQSLMPYNGSDNNTTGYLPTGNEWFYAAFSFLTNNTVRYAIRTPSQTLNGTTGGATHSPFNGYTMFGAGFGSPNNYNVFGTVRLGMFINDDFSTVEEMNTLFAQITAGPANGLPLT